MSSPSSYKSVRYSSCSRLDRWLGAGGLIADIQRRLVESSQGYENGSGAEDVVANGVHSFTSSCQWGLFN